MWNFSQRRRGSSWHLFPIQTRRLITLVACHNGETKMTTRTILAAVTALSLIAVPAIAQSTSGTEQNGHHYSGGPKTEVPHHMGKKETVGLATKRKSGGHHYSGGPGTSVPHHMGEKQQ
jgi:hypothetical protein